MGYEPLAQLGRQQEHAALSALFGKLGSASARTSIAALETFAVSSGGEAFFPESVATLPDEYRRVVDRLRQRYIASYLSTNPKRDGQWRAVDVSSDNPSLIIKSRGGYFAPER